MYETSLLRPDNARAGSLYSLLHLIGQCKTRLRYDFTSLTKIYDEG